MRVEILSPEEERKFLREYLSILFYDKAAEEVSRESRLIGIDDTLKNYSYDLIAKRDCRIWLNAYSPGSVEITSTDRTNGSSGNFYYLEYKTADGSTFKYSAQDDPYFFHYSMDPDMAKSVLQQGTIVCFSIGQKEFELDVPIPKMYDALQFLFTEDSFSDEQVDELYDAVSIQLKEKVQAIKKKEREDRKAEEERQRKINEEKVAPASPANNNGCYIATCVYGSYNCPEVWALRRFRDFTLNESWYGRAFINAYYAISPTLVKWFGKTKWFKFLFKKPLDSLVSKLRSNGVSSSPYNDKY